MNADENFDTLANGTKFGMLFLEAEIFGFPVDMESDFVRVKGEWPMKPRRRVQRAVLASVVLLGALTACGHTPVGTGTDADTGANIKT